MLSWFRKKSRLRLELHGLDSRGLPTKFSTFAIPGTVVSIEAVGFTVKSVSIREEEEKDRRKAIRLASRRARSLRRAAFASVVILSSLPPVALATHSPRSRELGVPPEVEAVLAKYAVNGRNTSLSAMTCESHKEGKFKDCVLVIAWFKNQASLAAGEDPIAGSLHSMDVNGNVGPLMKFYSKELTWERWDRKIGEKL